MSTILTDPNRSRAPFSFKRLQKVVPPQTNYVSRSLFCGRKTETGQTYVRHLCLSNLFYQQPTRTDTEFMFVSNDPCAKYCLLIAWQPLPPSYEKHLSGVPGFRANIDYAVQVIIDSKANVVPNLVKSALFGPTNPYVTFCFISIFFESSALERVVSTPLIYYPRTRPAVPPPVPLRSTSGGFVESPEWKVFEDHLPCKLRRGEEIISKVPNILPFPCPQVTTRLSCIYPLRGYSVFAARSPSASHLCLLHSPLLRSGHYSPQRVYLRPTSNTQRSSS